MSGLVFDRNSLLRARDFFADIAQEKPDVEFYSEHLDRVSRSFATCIAQLESPLREWVGMAYLLCRWLDTIEDAGWESKTAQLEAFSDFIKFFEDQLAHDINQQKMAPESCTAAVLRLKNITEAERKLIEDHRVLIAKFSLFPERVREIMACLVIDMASGMSHFVEAGEKLKSLRELNQYCFFVAGIVGEALTDMLEEVTHARMQSVTGAHHFGLFLQKINVLKDQFKDEAEGRFFVADRNEVINSLLVDAKFAIEYLISIPVEQTGYRTFCGWSYFLGLATLPLLRMQTPDQLEPKLERSMVEALFAMVSSRIHSNEQLLKLYFDLVDQIAAFQGTTPFIRPVAVNSEALPCWIRTAYGGRLKCDELKALGL